MTDTLPKTKPKRRWLQFSIRTVLVLVTLLCVGLSLWVASAERQRRAVAAIEALGGEVSYADSEGRSQSLPVAFLRRWLPQSYIDEVVAVNFGNADVTDDGLAHLEGLTSLQMLWLVNTQVTDDGLAHLEGLTNLRILWLYNTKITDAGLAHLEGLTNLQQLDLGSTQVTDAGPEHLRVLLELQWLYLQDTQITDAGLTELRKALPKCAIHGP